MPDETLNLEIRKFLKQFGVAAQSAIEQAAAGAPPGRRVRLRAVLEIDGRKDVHVQEAEIHAI
jgi:hypothetical protein